jgi:hypothetical protein
MILKASYPSKKATPFGPACRRPGTVETRLCCSKVYYSLSQTLSQDARADACLGRNMSKPGIIGRLAMIAGLEFATRFAVHP